MKSPVVIALAIVLVSGACGSKESKPKDVPHPRVTLPAEAAKLLTQIPAEAKFVIGINGKKVLGSAYWGLAEMQLGKRIPKSCLATLKKSDWAMVGMMSVRKPTSVSALSGISKEDIGKCLTEAQILAAPAADPAGQDAEADKTGADKKTALAPVAPPNIYGIKRTDSADGYELLLRRRGGVAMKWRDGLMVVGPPGHKHVANAPAQSAANKDNIVALLEHADPNNMLIVASDNIPAEVAFLAGAADRGYIGLTMAETLDVRVGLHYADRETASAQMKTFKEKIDGLKHSPGFKAYKDKFKVAQSAEFVLIDVSLTQADLGGIAGILAEDPFVKQLRNQF